MADPELQIKGGGGGHPDTEISGGWSPKNFFAALKKDLAKMAVSVSFQSSVVFAKRFVVKAKP